MEMPEINCDTKGNSKPEKVALQVREQKMAQPGVLVRRVD